MLRAAAARTIGQIADRESGEPILERLKEDPIEDVKRAADAGLRELRSPRESPARVEEEEAPPSLGTEAMSALQRLLQEMGEE